MPNRSSANPAYRTGRNRRDDALPSLWAGELRRRAAGDITNTGISPADWEAVKAHYAAKGEPPPSLVPKFDLPVLKTDPEAERLADLGLAKLQLSRLARIPLTGVRAVNEANQWTWILANAVADMVAEDVDGDPVELNRLVPLFDKRKDGRLATPLQTFMRRAHTLYGAFALPNPELKRLPRNAPLRAELRNRWDRRVSPLYTLL